MTILPSYQHQVELLLDVLPFIQKESCFALKGGTAINLFHRDMPRLSVDIDLTYLSLEPREIFLDNLSKAMERIANDIEQNGLQVEKRCYQHHVIKLLIDNSQATIKVEPNIVLRGSVFPTEMRELSDGAQAAFLQSQKVRIVSIADLYAGKICAALDRQHPRDLFDIKLLFDNEGITNAIRQAFVIYLASSPRPMNELLSPRELDIKNQYDKEFIGMTEVSIDYEILCETRKRLIKTLHESLSPNERKFLLTIKSGDPEWELMPLEGISELPGLQWKIKNVLKMDKKTRLQAFNKLRNILGI
ncbi:MAG: nucleotidyl transferase AbiEii/AbiGii toxin family protein [Gammaproteobacteria bacterium]|nr:nucleotidyl transferase AbiEii/AbiGii toxin family protein [Gammaproteobacteria bacterium]